MSEDEAHTVIVRDRESVRRLTAVGEWTWLTLLASLSADPRSFDELARAWLRYQPENRLEDMSWVAGAGEESPGPWTLLDLACLRVLAGGGAELPENPAAYQRDEGCWTPGSPAVWISGPPGWRWREGAEWEGALPPLPVPAEPLDARGVLFGRMLAEGIASRTLDIAAREPLPAEFDVATWERADSLSESQREAFSQWQELTVRVHADWLMTPREDLGGETPRHFLHQGRDWVDRELSNREQQWSNEGRASRPLDRDTFAYRYGPMGRHEVVMYFDLCRVVIPHAWKLIFETPRIDRLALTRALQDEARSWLEEGSIDGDPTPPAVIIENERRRMPLLSDGSHLDCDCPLCRMEADGALGFGPMFGGFDGHHLELDDEFAFSLYETREEWEAEQEQFAQFNAEMDAQQREGESTDEDDSVGSVWSASYVNNELVGREAPSSPLRVLGLATRVGELVTDLKQADAGRDLVDALNNAFDGFRNTADDLALSASASAQLADVLEEIASAIPQLTPKVADLQSQLDELRRERESDDLF